MSKVLLSLAFILAASMPESGWAQQPGSQNGPPLVEGRPGENLSETLDRTDGVIKPPPVDPGMAAPPPAVDTRTPDIEPPAPEQQNPPVKPER